MIRPLVVLGLVLIAGDSLAAQETGEFKPLFDGKSLDGWQGDPDLWSVEEGAIAGSTERKTLEHNSFLATERTYKNFVLKLKFKLRNGNSGVQIRSALHDDYVVKGYQADIADNNYLGILYEEGGRGILVDVVPEQVQPHVKPGDWNEYEIVADDGRITQRLNGYTTIEYDEQEGQGATEGIIALQLHVGDPMRIWFKDILIQELNGPEQADVPPPLAVESLTGPAEQAAVGQGADRVRSSNCRCSSPPRRGGLFRWRRNL